MKPFCIYFPQFYPTPTNNRAWGQGFTDWTLVSYANLQERWARRAPQRGFYDGSDAAVQHAQMQEMRESGLGGAAVYHYWFYTHQELGSFEHNLLATPGNDMPWFLVWASEGWYRRWLGDPTTLVDLTREPTDKQIEAHCEYLARCFAHPAYWRWQGRPMFVWYHLGHFSKPDNLVSKYREAFRSMGNDVAFAHFVKNPADIPLSDVVDASWLFEPRLYFGVSRMHRGTRAKWVLDTLRARFGERAAQKLLLLTDRMKGRGVAYSADAYKAYMGGPDRAALKASLPGVVQEVVSPGWNNAPRYGQRSTVLEDLEPREFGRQVFEAMAGCASLPPLINAWNEWSEGAAIEPCAYYGTRYLDALGRLPSSQATDRTPVTA